MWIVWIAGLKGPEPQLWMVWPHSSTGHASAPLAHRLLTSAEELESLATLALKYPVQS